MVTRVNMEEVRGFRDETRVLCREVLGDLQTIRRSLEAMGQMRGFSGQAADQTNRYVRTFHLTIVKTFDSLFTDLLVKLNQDIQAFHREVDTASRTQINRQALLELREDIQDDYRQFYRGYERARDSLLEVFDISGVKVPAIKNVSQDKGATREYISEVLDDLKGFDRRKKPRQIESVLDQLRKTLNQTKKLPAPLRAGHYQKLVTQGGLDGFNIYSNIVGRNPETRHVHGQLDALGIRP
ncbi:T7SS effector LXG polymorphic toxin, partial [Amphibacillus cookii]|uniref:T7SS effector LXG polymorphic toxin n=1 Tax=Amphibacillus cookii TaxID=767787 RepID=UPI001956364A